ncbi:phosphatases II [Xylariomycetidae sp. FL0641]|nr:phosphatases II [Xylariomycetidae sp. FL0641]
MALTRVPGPDNLYVGGLWTLNLESHRKYLYENNITHVLSAIKWSFERWGDEAKRFKHMSIDVDDVEETDLIVYFPAVVRFIDDGLHAKSNATSVSSPSPGVYVHCAMGKSRSVSCVMAYLLYKYPHRFGGQQWTPTAASAEHRRATASEAVDLALKCVREARSLAEPNDGFMRQLKMWWTLGCPADDDGAVERHPAYQKWLYDRMLQEARDLHMAPDAEQIRFGDEIDTEKDDEAASPAKDGKGVRCKKCRRILATPKFLISHAPTGQPMSANCAHIFVDTLSWMRPMLEDGALDGRLVCPNGKCGATVGRFAWQGLKCSCKEWVVPAFSLNRSRVDEVIPRSAEAAGIRMPPTRNGSL